MKQIFTNIIHGYAIFVQSLVVLLPLFVIGPVMTVIEKHTGWNLWLFIIIVLIPGYGLYCYAFRDRIRPTDLTPNPGNSILM